MSTPTVALRASPTVAGPAHESFGPLNTRQEAILAEYSPKLLRQFEDLLTRLRGTIEDRLAAG